MEKNIGVYEIRIHYGNGDKEMNRIEEIIYKGTQKAAYEEQCEEVFVHQEQPNEDYFEGLNGLFGWNNVYLKFALQK